jgi:small subunit ribosomal protein S4
MARYTGPSCRLCRRAGQKLFLKGDRCISPKCAIERRRAVPGDPKRRRRRLSDWGVHLREKQKARHTYGILEAQFRKHYEEARRQPGMTGENLLRILESRLDNVVYRLGFADSRKQARQMVRHGLISVNGRKTDIPSFLTRPGEVVTWTERGKKSEYHEVVAQTIRRKQIPSWLMLDVDNLAGRVSALPERGEIDSRVDERLIVEFYSR